MWHMGAWFTTNWFNLFSTIGVVGSLLFTAISLRAETKSRQIGNRLVLTQNHRELMLERLHNPKLVRISDLSPNLFEKPTTPDEAIYVNLVIQHVGSAYDALKAGLTIKPERLQQDVREFFSLPIPRAIWQKLRGMQNDDFVRFVEGCVASLESSRASENRI